MFGLARAAWWCDNPRVKMKHVLVLPSVNSTYRDNTCRILFNRSLRRHAFVALRGKLWLGDVCRCTRATTATSEGNGKLEAKRDVDQLFMNISVIYYCAEGGLLHGRQKEKIFCCLDSFEASNRLICSLLQASSLHIWMHPSSKNINERH